MLMFDIVGSCSKEWLYDIAFRGDSVSMGWLRIGAF